ncbi:hypothetical protein THARTR1_03812 [Trichoderma harzianum]|uniref:Gamma-glutamyltranspeptidase n=1 Tax=Trichoderma harzianum TaxID=5544 RepID=A0A2K0UEW2_TRIHA|nr:hypothetical protein THARTR1_03812 [Trichoderma harzianum]
MTQLRVRSVIKPLAIFLSLLPYSRASPTPPCSTPPGVHIPKQGAVASQSTVCSEIGIQLLKDGGNAVDALVGTVFCVGVIGMYHSGIGGGGFLLLRTSDGKYDGVPGELRGTEYIHNKYGALPWAHVIKPSIDVARNGFKVTEDLVNTFKSTSSNNFLTEDPAWAIDFAPKGRLVRLGETMTRKRYADVLSEISHHGADAFYTGPIANATIRALKAAGGIMTLEDLKNYTVAIREPLQINYRGYKLTSTSAPSSGAVVLSALNTVSGYEGFGDPSQVNLTTHRLDEAIRFAYGQRTELGDPSFVEGLDKYSKEMIAPATGAEIRSKISDFKAQNVSYYDPKGLESLETPGTSHIVAADASGMAVSMTTTINLLFGSTLIVPETGVIMNNEMNDFSIPGVSNSFGYIPSPANYIRPGKRPLSSISPIIAETADGKLYLALGAAGGSRIITANIQNTIHVLDSNMTTAEALLQPRLHDQLVPAQTSFEYAYDNRTVAFMKSVGHNITWVAPGQSTAQALRLLPNGTFEAAGEPRQVASGGFAI